MFNHCRVSEWAHVCTRVCLGVCACERVQIYVSACFCVCVRHDTRLRCKNDQMSLLLFFSFFFFILIPLFVSATTLIHSILLFITKWLLTKLLYALRGAHTNVLITPSPIVEGSIHMQVTHKVGSIEFCYIFLTFVLLQRNTPCHCMKPASVFGVLNALLHLLKMKSKWLSQALI